jgi:hypothetical protein
MAKLVLMETVAIDVYVPADCDAAFRRKLRRVVRCAFADFEVGCAKRLPPDCTLEVSGLCGDFQIIGARNKLALASKRKQDRA